MHLHDLNEFIFILCRGNCKAMLNFLWRDLAYFSLLNNGMKMKFVIL